MACSEPPAGLDAVRIYRLGRLRAEMAKRQVGGVLLVDPINLRYATDCPNMQIWSMHDETRCVLVTQEAMVLFDYDNLPYMAEGLPSITEYRVMPVFYYFAAGPRAKDTARRFGREIAALMARLSPGNKRLAIDRLSLLGIEALRDELDLVDAWPIAEHARSIKSVEEIGLMQAALAVCEAGCAAMREALVPGITENALWARLHETNIRLGGEWIETRLLSSGPRTNPWFRECSMRRIERGDMVSFDTDLIGPYGYCADISRSWVCGEAPTAEQRTLYATAHEQLEHNIGILRPGLSFREVAERSWPIPEKYRSRRYSCLAHGVGLADEWPSIPYLQDFDALGYDGVLEPGMALCIESFIGIEGGREGVKLEEQVLITETGVRRLSGYRFEDALLA
jgi:Xaa-Pro aminopeptidase